ncbi:hypothetical protein OROGR_014375 [Orobanche gracilis]
MYSPQLFTRVQDLLDRNTGLSSPTSTSTKSIGLKHIIPELYRHFGDDVIFIRLSADKFKHQPQSAFVESFPTYIFRKSSRLRFGFLEFVSAQKVGEDIEDEVEEAQALLNFLLATKRALISFESEIVSNTNSQCHL